VGRGFVAVALVGAFGLLVAASAGGEPGADVGPVGSLTRASSADVDGDGLFDDLAARLEQLEASDRVSVIVRLDGALTRLREDAVESAVGGYADEAWLPIIDGFAATMTKAQVEALPGLGAVATVEENGVVHAHNESAQAAFGVTRARIDHPGLDGDGVVVGVIDSGIDASHPQLDDGKVVHFVNCVSVPVACNSVPPLDDNDHGTHVAGTIAGDGEGDPRHRGVAPAADLVGIKVLNGAGSGSDAQVIAGIQWAATVGQVTHGIDVVNLSLGRDGCHSGLDATSSAANAAAASLTVVVSAGNSGPGTCTVGSPGVAEDVITVGAMADTGVEVGGSRSEVPGFNQAYFSSRGPTQDGRVKPDVSAPGVQITSAAANSGGQYETLAGTSMAAPFVTGVAALMLDQNASLTNAGIKSALMSTAVDWGRGGSHLSESGSDIDYGAGRLDAFAALKAVGAPLGNAPAGPAHQLLAGTLPATGAVQTHPVIVDSTAFPLSATLIMTGFAFGAPDFDLQVIAPDGVTTLQRSEFSDSRQEEVGILPPGAGVYSFAVRSFSGSGDYILDVSGGLSPPPPPPAPAPPPPAAPPPAPPPPPPPAAPPPRTPTATRCVVPNLKGKTVAKAKAALKARRCAAGRIKRVFSRKVKKGRVIAQGRRPGSRHARNTRVGLTVSKGARRR
jgi:serine protease AprX